MSVGQVDAAVAAASAARSPAGGEEAERDGVVVGVGRAKEMDVFGPWSICRVRLSAAKAYLLLELSQSLM